MGNQLPPPQAFCLGRAGGRLCGSDKRAPVEEIGYKIRTNLNILQKKSLSHAVVVAVSIYFFIILQKIL